MAGPTFICPGVQKAGTTWLNAQLKEHPDFWMPPQKEMDYLGDFPTSREKYRERLPKVMAKLAGKKKAEDRRAWWELFNSPWSLDKYPKLFELAGDKLSGDISPKYALMSADDVRRTAAMLPEAKIVILLRDPVDRAWSQARYAVSRGKGKDLPPDEQFERMVELATSEKRLERGEYVRLIRDWSEAFGKDKVFIGFYDDLKDDPRALLDAILAFLGASPTPAEQEAGLGEVVNRGAKSVSCPPEVRETLAKHYAPMLAELATMLPEPRPAWVK